MDTLTLQNKLKAAGFDPGPLDGIDGPRTAFALDAARQAAKGRAECAAASFDAAFDRLIGHEGGYVNDSRDPGGETNWGVSKRAFPDVDIRRLTRDGAKAIYRSHYWTPIHADLLPAALAFQAFDVAVNHGVGRAVKMLQQVAGAQVDGILGPVTLAAIELHDPADLVLRFNALRLRFYTDLDGWKTFGKGWTRRVAGNLDYAAADLA